MLAPGASLGLVVVLMPIVATTYRTDYGTIHLRCGSGQIGFSGEGRAQPPDTQ